MLAHPGLDMLLYSLVNFFSLVQNCSVCCRWPLEKKKFKACTIRLDCFGRFLGISEVRHSFMVQYDNKLLSEVVQITTLIFKLIFHGQLLYSERSLVALSVPKYHVYYCTDLQSEPINERFACFAIFILITYIRIT